MFFSFIILYNVSSGTSKVFNYIFRHFLTNKQKVLEIANSLLVEHIGGDSPIPMNVDGNRKKGATISPQYIIPPANFGDSSYQIQIDQCLIWNTGALCLFYPYKNTSLFGNIFLPKREVFFFIRIYLFTESPDIS